MYQKNIRKNTFRGTLSKRRGYSQTIIIDEPGFYGLVFALKLPEAKKFQDWVFSPVLPCIRKYKHYKLFDNPNNHMFKIQNEFDLHTEVVQYIRRFYLTAIIVAGLGELQDTPAKRINSWKQRICERPA